MNKFRHFIFSGAFVVYRDDETLRATFKKNDIHRRLVR